MTDDRMLTDDQLAAIRQDHAACGEGGDCPAPALLRHIEALQQERNFWKGWAETYGKANRAAEDMVIEHGKAKRAAQKRAEGLETLLHRLLKAIGHGDETSTYLSFKGEWVHELAEAARDARAALEGDAANGA